MGVRTPETCLAVHKRQVIKLYKLLRLVGWFIWKVTVHFMLWLPTFFSVCVCVRARARALCVGPLRIRGRRKRSSPECPNRLWCLSLGETRQGVNLATHLHLIPKLRINVAIPPLPHTTSCREQGQVYISPPPLQFNHLVCSFVTEVASWYSKTLWWQEGISRPVPTYVGPIITSAFPVLMTNRALYKNSVP